jgi:HSP20 family protein
MFDNFYGQPQTGAPGATTAIGERTWTFSPVLESAWNENYLNLRAILPGISEHEVRVTVQNNQLVVEGERRLPEGWEKNAFTQLAYGKFYTAVTLPAGLDVDHINCRLHNGILDMQLPILEASKPKQIQIQVNSSDGRKAIAA